MADDEVGAGIDGRMGDVRHVSEDLAAEPPVARGDENIDVRAQRRDVVAEPSEIIRIGPGDDFRRDPGRLGGGTPTRVLNTGT